MYLLYVKFSEPEKSNFVENITYLIIDTKRFILCFIPTLTIKSDNLRITLMVGALKLYLSLSLSIWKFDKHNDVELLQHNILSRTFLTTYWPDPQSKHVALHYIYTNTLHYIYTCFQCIILIRTQNRNVYQIY